MSSNSNYMRNRANCRSNDSGESNSYCSGLRFHCHCGLETTIKTSRTERNPGRRFYCCSLKEEHRCNFFRWCDESTREPSVEVISGLLTKLNLYEQENSNLKAQVLLYKRKVETMKVLCWTAIIGMLFIMCYMVYV
ncbi:hypothetical protein ACP275_10G079800 [Erythranthe tilingii]